MEHSGCLNLPRLFRKENPAKELPAKLPFASAPLKLSENRGPALPDSPGQRGANTAPSSAPVCALGHLPPRGKAREECRRRNSPALYLTRPDCASNLQNGHAISRILTTPTYRIDLSIPKYHPGAHRAPQRNPISIFPSPSSPRTPHHPHPEPWRGTLERTRARQHLLHILARTLPFPTHSAAKQMAHAGAGFPPRRPVPGGRDGVWEQAGAPAHGHKKRALEHIQDP